jgi:hypothetical protein
MDRKERLEKLINKYLEYKNNSKAEMSSEATTRVWINEMLEIFGWDVLDTKHEAGKNCF